MRIRETSHEDRKRRGIAPAPHITNTTSVRALERVNVSLAEKESFERIFQADALEAHKNYGGEAFEEALEVDTLTVLITDEPLPFCFAIDDASISIVGHDLATGLPTVHVESDNDRARTWLEGLYKRYRKHAQVLD